MAASYETQRANIPDYVPLVDDIIETFRNGFFVLPGPIRGDYLSKEIIADVIALYSQVDIVSEDAELCTDQALREHKNWSSIRKLANHILDEIKTEDRNPNLNHITWIRK